MNRFTIDGSPANSRQSDLLRAVNRRERKWPGTVFLAVLFAAAAWSWSPLFLAVLDAYTNGR